MFLCYRLYCLPPEGVFGAICVQIYKKLSSLKRFFRDIPLSFPKFGMNCSENLVKALSAHPIIQNHPKIGS